MGQIIIPVTKDAMINNSSTSTNLNDRTLIVGKYQDSFFYRALLYFNLVSLSDKQITSAYLRLCQANGGGSAFLDFGVFRILEDWGESTVNWDNRPDISETDAMSFNLSETSQSWRDFDITTLVKDIISGSLTYYGFMLRQPGDTDNAYKIFFTHEQAGDYYPRLIVNYISGFKARVGDSWRDNTQTYVRQDGVWREGYVSTRQGGVWKEGM